MRMWMTDPAGMCRKHLLGEHVELHMFAGSLRKGFNLAGYYSRGLLEPTSLAARHERLVEEFGRRGFNHASVLNPLEIEALVAGLPEAVRGARVNPAIARAELMRRCPECRAGLISLNAIYSE